MEVQMHWSMPGPCFPSFSAWELPRPCLALAKTCGFGTGTRVECSALWEFYWLNPSWKTRDWTEEFWTWVCIWRGSQWSSTWKEAIAHSPLCPPPSGLEQLPAHSLPSFLLLPPPFPGITSQMQAWPFLPPFLSQKSQLLLGLYTILKKQKQPELIHNRSPRQAWIHVGRLFDYKFLMQRLYLICFFVTST